LEVALLSLGDLFTKKKIKRRTFLTFCGLAGAAVAVGVGCNPKPEEIVEDDPYSPVALADYQEGEWVPTGCAGCTSWCSLEANVVGGRVIKVRGNALSKVNGAANCPRSHMSILQLYDPDRIKVPMKRTNPVKGKDEDPGFVPITWDEAADIMAEKIMELRENNETHKFAVFRGRYTQLNENIYGRVPAIIGSPNNISHSSICAEAEKFGPYYAQGYWNYRDYDLNNTTYALLWGVDPISANRQISYYLSAWGDLLDRAKVAVVDPRLSASASKADEWLPVKPGQDGALATAMAHVILTEGLWNREFVGDFADGSNKFVAGETVNEDSFNENYTYGLVKWWNLELKDRTPQWAAEKTGLPVEQIIRVAREFAEAGPGAICYMGGGAVMQTRGAYNSMAVYSLNGLVGSIEQTVIQGASVPHQGLPDNADFIDEIANANRGKQKIDQRGYKELPALASGRSGGGVVTNRIADAIIAEDPYDLKVIIAYWCNFNFSCPETERWHKAMAKVPFLAHIVTHDSEMSRYADLLLPSTHHMFEQWGYLTQKGNTYTHAWLARPMIEKFWDVKNAETEVMWLLGEKLADKGFSNLLDYFKSVKDPETGREPTNGQEFEEYAVKHRLRPIWDPAEYKSGDKFNGWEDFKTAGVWNSAPYKFKERWGNFATSTKQFEFYSETLKEALQGHAEKHNTTIDNILAATDYDVSGDRAFVPHYEEPLIRGDQNEYPLVLVDTKSRFNREGRSANCICYYEFKDVDPGDERNKDVAKINPRDAAALGIRDGDLIKVQSTVGEIQCYAKLWEGTMPGTLIKTYGQGHWAYGRVAAEDFERRIPRGGNSNDIIAADYDRLSGSTTYYASTRVKVVRA
jgi:anaerobic selenocysteine-containing dehydrogenase